MADFNTNMIALNVKYTQISSHELVCAGSRCPQGCPHAPVTLTHSH